MPAGSPTRLSRGAAAIGLAAVLALPPGAAARAAQSMAERIDSFGPYTLGMTLDQAKAAHKAGKPAACGDVAADRQCILLDAAVFEEPARLFAVLDKSGARVERIVAQLEPQRTQRRAYRCVRLAEKVFALLVVVYGSKYKQSYDENRRPLPAVAWDGALAGRLVFEARCRTADEGEPRISVVAYYPDGVEPPKVAQPAVPEPAAPALAGRSQPPAAPGTVPAGRTGGEAPAPLRAPIGVVEQIGPVTDHAAAAETDAAVLKVEREKARVEREMAVAEGKGEHAAAADTAPPMAPGRTAPAEAPAPPVLPAAVPIPTPMPAPTQPARITLAPASPPASPPAPRPAPALSSSVPATPAAKAPVAAEAPAKAPQTAALPPVQPARFDDPDELPEPSDLVAPEPFMVPEEEAYFRRLREAPESAPPTRQGDTASATLMWSGIAAPPPAAAQDSPRPAAQTAPVAAAAPIPAAPEKAAAAERTVPEPGVPEARETPPPSALSAPSGAVKAMPGVVVPVLTGGWRHQAPVPPAKPWRDRGAVAG